MGFKVFKMKFVIIGVGICWDQWFLEVVRVMVFMGVEVLFYLMVIGLELQDGDLDLSEYWWRVMQGYVGVNFVFLVVFNWIGQEIIEIE